MFFCLLWPFLRWFEGKSRWPFTPVRNHATSTTPFLSLSPFPLYKYIQACHSDLLIKTSNIYRITLFLCPYLSNCALFPSLSPPTLSLFTLAENMENNINDNNNINENEGQWARIVIYQECQRNYATRRGRYTVDGCREFIKAGADGTVGASVCAACGCHRNFHRKEEVSVRVEPGAMGPVHILHRLAEFAIAPPPPLLQAPPQYFPHHHFAGQNNNNSNNEENDNENLGDGEIDDEPEGRRRGRTRLTETQKEMMRGYANMLEWSLQGLDEVDLREFCHGIGVTPRVFKIWMRNNKNKYYVDPNAGEPSNAGFDEF